jgi:MFS family permease
MNHHTPSRLERDLRAMVGDGIAFSAMVGIGETYVPAFALAAGLSDVVAGLVAIVPILGGAFLQLVTPMAVRRLGSYRRWVVICARLQAMSFLPLIGAALVGRISAPWLLLTMAAYWGFGMATSPAWNTWAGSLVPCERRAAFFAHRTRWSQAALFGGVLAGGLALEAGERFLGTTGIFALLFTLASASRWISARNLARQSEAPGLARSHRALPLSEMYRYLRAADAGRVLLYLVAMQVAVQIAAPFFTPFMLGPLGLPYWGFTALTAASFLARIALLPLIGRIARARGTGHLLRIGAISIVPLPGLWLVSENFFYLLAVQVLAGFAWAALELATLLAFFEGLGERERTSILTAFNLVNTVAMTGGALLGGLVLGAFAEPAAAYAAVFLLSVGARLTSLALLGKVRAVPRVAEVPALRTLAVRPSLGAVQRPVLPTLSAPAGSSDEAPGS